MVGNACREISRDSLAVRVDRAARTPDLKLHSRFAILANSRSLPSWIEPRPLVALAVMVLVTSAASAAGAGPPPAQASGQTNLVCESKSSQREICSANTKGGVTLVRTLGAEVCEFGRNWGYDEKGIWVSDGCSGEFAVSQTTPAPASTPARVGSYTPTGGFKVADTEYGDLNLRLFTYLRYLNQRFVDDRYTNAFGTTTAIQQRQDFQLNKMQVYFFGWLMSPKFRYLSYVWTTNASLGLSSQVVVGGNLSYRFSDYFTLGGGISALPGVRTTEGTFPYWLGVDSRLIADEFFRPSYTTGLFVEGTITDGLEYRAMLGNNLSQLGIDAGQIDNSPDTFSASLVWMPTTGEFGTQNGFGDFEYHDDLATRLGIRYSRSHENRQNQPDTDAFDNVQLRVSDGSVIFTPGLFAPGFTIDEATYQMISIDGGFKFRGVSADFEYYRRRLDNFVVRPRALPFAALHDNGFQLQGSAMAIPDTLQVYAGVSKVFGEFGDPSDFRIGATFFPWENQVVRWNVEYLDVNRSPVGASSLPYAVGMDGPVFHSSFMLWF